MSLNFTDSGFLYKVKIDDIHVDKVDIAVKTISFIPGTSDIRILLSGIDLKMKINGAIYALWIIPITTSALNVVNFTLQMDLSAPTTDNVNW